MLAHLHSLSKAALDRARLTANVYRSSVVCEAAATKCEDGLEAEQRMRLPSTGRFRWQAAEMLHVRTLQASHTCSASCLKSCRSVSFLFVAISGLRRDWSVLQRPFQTL